MTKCPTSPSKAHYWQFSVPDGPTSHGVCKHCGKETDQPNSFEYNNWRKGRHGKASTLKGSQAGGKARAAKERAK